VQPARTTPTWKSVEAPAQWVRWRPGSGPRDLAGGVAPPSTPHSTAVTFNAGHLMALHLSVDLTGDKQIGTLLFDVGDYLDALN